MEDLLIPYSTKTWGVVDKPPGMSSHNEPGRDLQSLLSKKFGVEIYLVNRLDRETSGLMVYALVASVVPDLQKALSDVRTQKIYKAILRGQLNLIPQAQENWIWPLTDKAEGRKNPQGERASRKSCVTKTWLLQKNQYFSFVECEIETGRQHQIRKHAALAKHTIIGDTRYGDSNFNDKISKMYNVDRLFLHCSKLVLLQGDNKTVVESPLPADFNLLLPISKS
jgi:tRNA pseudouridine65 synthase